MCLIRKAGRVVKLEKSSLIWFLLRRVKGLKCTRNEMEWKIEKLSDLEVQIYEDFLSKFLFFHRIIYITN